eukprot:g7749.t1
MVHSVDRFVSRKKKDKKQNRYQYGSKKYVKKRRLRKDESSNDDMMPSIIPFNAWLDDTQLKKDINSDDKNESNVMFFMSPVRAKDNAYGIARKTKRERIIEVRRLGVVYYFKMLPQIIFTRNLVIVNPAIRRIQGMYRAWKRREPIRHYNAAQIIQMCWRRHASRNELSRRFKGLDRKNENRFGHFSEVSLVITATIAQTEDIYDPYMESNHMAFDLWMTRLGLKKHLAQVKRRGKMMKVLNKKETDYENKQLECKQAEEAASELEIKLKEAEKMYEEAVSMSNLIMKAAIAAAQREASMPPPPPRKKPSGITKLQNVARFGAVCSICKERKAVRRCIPCKVPFCLMCFNKSHAYLPKSRHAFIPIGRGLGVVGAGTRKTTKVVRPSGVQCNKCEKRRASYEFYIHKLEKKEYEPDTTEYVKK